jgi:hypothetical protein
MSLDPPFREEAKSFTGVRAFSDAENLNFQRSSPNISPRMKSLAPSIPLLPINGA